jgi:23S rRNA pseudouridine1911/1915/1917 synthase
MLAPDARAVVSAALDGARVDVAVARLLDVPTAAAKRLCAAGRVRVERDGRGRAAKKGDRVAAGDAVVVRGGDAWFVVDGAPVVVEVARVGDVVVVDKPAFVPCHPLVPGEGGTVADAIVAVDAAAAAASVDVREAGLVHRLDNETSGCLAYALTRNAWEAARAALDDPTAEKHYLALVGGVVDAAFVVDDAIGHAGALMKIDPAGRPAQTTVTPLSTSTSTSTKASLVRLTLVGGRRHQLRVHLAARGHALVGDVDYGGVVVDVDGVGVGADGFFLHAASLAFGAVRARAPLPERFLRAAAALGVAVVDVAEDRA